MNIEKIDFFCVGAQKAGTTFLHDVLVQHPDIYLPPDKEVHFFDINELYNKGLDYYKSFFNTYQGEKIIGNINPNLQISKRSIDRIIETYGRNVKIIFLLRDPVKRAYSHYLMSKKRAYEGLDFKEALKSESKRINSPRLYSHYYTKELGHYEKDHLGYIYRGLYSKTLTYIYSNFPEENIKVMLFEDLISQKQKKIDEIIKFLGLKIKNNLNLEAISNPAQKAKLFRLSKFLHTSSPLKKFLKIIAPPFVRRPIKGFVNKINMKKLSKEEKTLSENDYNFARKYFKLDIEKVEKILDRKISEWKY